MYALSFIKGFVGIMRDNVERREYFHQKKALHSCHRRREARGEIPTKRPPSVLVSRLDKLEVGSDTRATSTGLRWLPHKWKPSNVSFFMVAATLWLWWDGNCLRMEFGFRGYLLWLFTIFDCLRVRYWMPPSLTWMPWKIWSRHISLWPSPAHLHPLAHPWLQL